LEDLSYMHEALLEAQKAFEAREVPVGAVLVLEGRIIARAHNLTEARRDPTAHAEMLCLQAGARELNNWRLAEATLYCTLEPCPMCAGAMIQARLKAVVWGAPDVRCGAHGSWVDLLKIPHPIHHFEVRRGVLEREASELMRAFFRMRRSKKDAGRTI